MGGTGCATRKPDFLHQLIDVESFQYVRERIEDSTGLCLQVRLATGEPWPDTCCLPTYCALVKAGAAGDICCHNALVDCPAAAGEIRDYPCGGVVHGLVAPLILDNDLVATLVLGPFVYREPGRGRATKAASLPGIDEDLLLQALREIPFVSKKRVSELKGVLSSISLLLGDKLRAAQRIIEINEQAERERQKLEAVISGMSDGVLILDRQGRVMSINRAGSDILAPIERGTSLAKIYETVEARISGSESVSSDICPIERVLATGVPMANFEFLIRRPDGEARSIHSSAAPTYDVDGRISGAVTVFRDVTAAKQMDRLKDELVSVVSHELRAPLATISGFTQMLIKQLSRKEGLERELSELELIRGCVHKLSLMVRNLLDVSRHQSGSLTLGVKAVALSDLIRVCASKLEYLSHNHHLVVYCPGESPIVVADENRVEQILTNLISNAIKFSPDGGDVIISTQMQDGEAVVSIRDQGIGIGKNDLTRLFDRFYRVDNTEGRLFEGMGLGLHVSKILVEAQGGRIWARSRKGYGSVFSFTLPLYGGGSAESSGC